MVDDRASILNTIKPMVNVEVDDTNFDTVLIPFINGALSVMTQLGVGPSSGFRIKDETAIWSELLGTREDLDLVITDVALRVRLKFDPPQNSFLVKAIQDDIQESDWRIQEWHKPPVIIAEPVPEEDPDSI